MHFFIIQFDDTKGKKLRAIITFNSPSLTQVDIKLFLNNSNLTINIWMALLYRDIPIEK